MSAARDRLASYYNLDPYNEDTNPGGMIGVGAMAANWLPCLRDIAAVVLEVVTGADAVTTATPQALEAAARADAAAAVAAGAAGATLNATGVSGTGDAVTVTVGVALSAYFDLLTVRLVWPAANTTAATTLAITSTGTLTAKPVRDAAGNALAPGALAAGALVTATYISASDHWRVGGGGGTDLSEVHAAICGFM